MNHKESRKRIMLSLSEEEVADLGVVADVVKPSSWATIAVRKAIERAKSGTAYEELNDKELSVVRVLRQLKQIDKRGYEGLVGLCAWSAFSIPVRERVLQLAEEFETLLESASSAKLDIPPTKSKRPPSTRRS